MNSSAWVNLFGLAMGAILKKSVDMKSLTGSASHKSNKPTLNGEWFENTLHNYTFDLSGWTVLVPRFHAWCFLL